MTLEEFKRLCENPDFLDKMRIAMKIMDENVDVLRALADGAVPTEEGKEWARAMREIVGVGDKDKATKIIDGLIILNKYESNWVGADHDIIYAGPFDTDLISKEDATELNKLGWSLQKDGSGWSIFT